MNNRRGDTSNISMIIILFISVLVGAILLLAAAQQVGTTVNLVTVINSTNTAPANGGVFNITSYRSISGVTVRNATGGEVIGAGNYTITNNVVLNGAFVVQVTVDDAEYASSTWNLSYTAQPLTYIADAGARALTNLIIIMFALAVAVVAMSPMGKDGFMKMLGE